MISPSVAAQFAGLEEWAAREGSRLLVDRGEQTILELIQRGHRTGVRVAYYGGLEKSQRFQTLAAGALIPVRWYRPGDSGFLAGLEENLIGAGFPRDLVSIGLERLSAGLGQLDQAA